MDRYRELLARYRAHEVFTDEEKKEFRALCCAILGKTEEQVQADEQAFLEGFDPVN
ncbi:MAG: hypothetical protein ACYCOU_03690 [Sulfobacillus sp.]